MRTFRISSRLHNLAFTHGSETGRGRAKGVPSMLGRPKEQVQVVGMRVQARTAEPRQDLSALVTNPTLPETSPWKPFNRMKAAFNPLNQVVEAAPKERAKEHRSKGGSRHSKDARRAAVPRKIPRSSGSSNGGRRSLGLGSLERPAETIHCQSSSPHSAACQGLSAECAHKYNKVAL